MIQDEKQLSFVREQLARAEAALDSLREEVLPQNKNMYEVMSESYIDMILNLRAEIDTYLGISAIPDSTELIISLEGQKVGLGHTSAGVVTRFVDTFRRGLQSVIDILEMHDRPNTARRRERWIEEICDLPFVGVAPGSVKILLGEPEFESLLADEHRQTFEDALNVMFAGLSWADIDGLGDNHTKFDELDADQRQALLALVTRLLPPKTGDVEKVAFQKRQPPGQEAKFITATLSRKSRERIQAELKKMASDATYVELEGTIRQVDLDSQTFYLRERPDDEVDIQCEYASDLEDAVKEFLDCRVIVSGIIEESRKTNRQKMSADSIDLLSDRQADEINPDKEATEKFGKPFRQFDLPEE